MEYADFICEPKYGSNIPSVLCGNKHGERRMFRQRENSDITRHLRPLPARRGAVNAARQQQIHTKIKVPSYSSITMSTTSGSYTATKTSSGEVGFSVKQGADWSQYLVRWPPRHVDGSVGAGLGESPDTWRSRWRELNDSYVALGAPRTWPH